MKYQKIPFLVFIVFLSSCSMVSTNTTECIKITETIYSPINPTSTQSTTSFQSPTPNPQPYPTSTPPLQQRSEFDNVSGTYKVTRNDGGECVIKVALTDKSAFDTLNFELFCIRGAPSYNSGIARGNLLFGHDIAVYNSPIGKCNIVLQFHEKSIEVTQIGLDYECGFGATIYADGTYYLIDDTPPIIGCMNLINSCNLEEPIP